jgi:hypothetical protein
MPPCPSFTVTPEGLPDGTTGAAYSQSFMVTGGAVHCSFAVFRRWDSNRPHRSNNFSSH